MVLFLSFGCSYVGFSSEEYLKKYGQWRRSLMAELEVYIGKSKDEILRVFGKPSAQKNDIYFRGNEYDEMILYKYEKGIPVFLPSQYLVSFYLNDRHVAVIDVM